MVIINTYTVRVGNSLVDIALREEDRKVITFAFGTETQKINMCEVDYNVLKSDDMCLRGGLYNSASYKGLPALVNGRLAFSSTVSEPPIKSNSYKIGCKED